MELNEISLPAFGEVAERLRRSTVLIDSGLRAKASGKGCGVIWSDSGLIVTNAHLIQGTHAYMQLWDGREFEAEVSERDHSHKRK
jgi:S1-C subfamily serine protease